MKAAKLSLGVLLNGKNVRVNNGFEYGNLLDAGEARDLHSTSCECSIGPIRGLSGGTEVERLASEIASGNRIGKAEESIIQAPLESLRRDSSIFRNRPSVLHRIGEGGESSSGRTAQHAAVRK